jgi:hypothetical protein
LAIQNGSAYVLTEKGLRLYYALIDLIYGIWGREIARKVMDVRKADRKRRSKRAKAPEQAASQIAQ